MKRNKLLKHLHANHCELARNGSKHDIFRNNITGKKTTIPRHSDVDDRLCEKICQQLGIPKI